MSRQALRALEQALGQPPPAGLAERLDAPALAELTTALEEACRSQASALDTASDQALEQIPSLVRGPLRRIVFR